jgi:CRISPR-associated protein Cas5d
MSEYPPVDVKVWGDFACFTRPEMKVERVSYDVITPSAARGVLEAIFWKPEFFWQIREIWVLKPIRHFSILRNEVKSKAVVSTAKGWAENGGGYFAEDDRAQRHTLALRDVAYVIKADAVLKAHATDDVAKYRDQFRRRVDRSQCHAVPYLGCREFTAYFGRPEGSEQPIDFTDDLGRMLFDIDYAADNSGRGTPCFFGASLESGILKIPVELYEMEK